MVLSIGFLVIFRNRGIFSFPFLFYLYDQSIERTSHFPSLLSFQPLWASTSLLASLPSSFQPPWASSSLLGSLPSLFSTTMGIDLSSRFPSFFFSATMGIELSPRFPSFSLFNHYGHRALSSLPFLPSFQPLWASSSLLASLPSLFSATMGIEQLSLPLFYT